MNYYLDREGLIELWSRIKSSFTTGDQVQNIFDDKINDLDIIYQSDSIPEEIVNDIFNGETASITNTNDFLSLEGLMLYNNLIKQYINNSSGDKIEWGALGKSSEKEED